MKMSFQSATVQHSEPYDTVVLTVDDETKTRLRLDLEDASQSAKLSFTCPSFVTPHVLKDLGIEKYRYVEEGSTGVVTLVTDRFVAEEIAKQEQHDA